jgi:hypothetical protein
VTSLKQNGRSIALKLKRCVQSYDLNFHDDGIQQNFGCRVTRLKGEETNVLFSSTWASKLSLGPEQP